MKIPDIEDHTENEHRTIRPNYIQYPGGETDFVPGRSNESIGWTGFDWLRGRENVIISVLYLVVIAVTLSQCNIAILRDAHMRFFRKRFILIMINVFICILYCMLIYAKSTAWTYEVNYNYYYYNYLKASLVGSWKQELSLNIIPIRSKGVFRISWIRIGF